MKAYYLIEGGDENLDRSRIKKIIVLFMFGLLIITAISMLFWNNRKMDRELSTTIRNNSEIINDAKVCLNESSVAQRMLLNLAIISDLKEREILMSEWKAAFKRNDESFQALNISFPKSFISDEQLLEKAKSSKENYFKSSTEFLALTNEGDRNKISDFLLKELKPNYESYQLSQKAIFDTANKELLNRTESITTKSNYIAWIMLVIGMFPFVFTIYKIGSYFINGLTNKIV